MSEEHEAPGQEAAAPQQAEPAEPETGPAPGSEAPTEAHAAPADAGRSRVLRRSRDDRMLGGVAGGLGRYFGVDPVLIRVAFVLLVFAGGAGALAYVVLWILVPEERPGETVGMPAETYDENRLRDVLGLGLVALGVFFLLRALLPDLFDWDYVWPVLLIATGALVLIRGTRR